MKHVAPLRFGAFAIALLFAFSSCRKEIVYLNQFPDPLKANATGQVAEYHNDRYDAFLGPQDHFLFTKLFDHSGNVSEIICGFDNGQLVYFVQANMLDLHIYDKGRHVYLVTQGASTSDTTAHIYLNAFGRPDSAIGNYRLFYHNPDDETPRDSTAIEKTYFSYQDHRLVGVKTVNYSGGTAETLQDVVQYDSVGNPVSFGPFTYAYDYTRKPKQQFYIDYINHSRNEYYLLQYLGYFPEVTSPINLRINQNGLPTIREVQFDGDDREYFYMMDEDRLRITYH